MDFSTSVISSVRQWRDFEGRACRAEFWWFYFFSLIVFTLHISDDDQVAEFARDWPFIIYEYSFMLWDVILMIGLIIASLAVGARRLHDTGRTGWWQLLYLVPVFGHFALLLMFWSESEACENRFGQAVQ